MMSFTKLTKSRFIPNNPVELAKFIESLGNAEKYKVIEKTGYEGKSMYIESRGKRIYGTVDHIEAAYQGYSESSHKEIIIRVHYIDDKGNLEPEWVESEFGKIDIYVQDSEGETSETTDAFVEEKFIKMINEAKNIEQLKLIQKKLSKLIKHFNAKKETYSEWRGGGAKHSRRRKSHKRRRTSKKT